MSELKAYLCIEAKTIEQKDFLCYRFTSATKSAPEACMEEVYIKSEADEVIEEMSNKLDSLRYIIAVTRKDKNYQKYKRCLGMAKRCKSEYVHRKSLSDKEQWYWRRWYNKWLELAEKFKPNSTAQ